MTDINDYINSAEFAAWKAELSIKLRKVLDTPVSQLKKELRAKKAAEKFIKKYESNKVR